MAKFAKKAVKINWQFSPKQLFAMYWWKDERCKNADGLIAYGSVRSGKTVSMSLGFVQWAMESFDECNFIFCGKTIKSFERNVLTPLKNYLVYLGYRFHHSLSENLLTVMSPSNKVNYFYIFGGADERSQALVQGITSAGALLDEVVLMPESFVNQVMARCSIAGAKVWLNCNPEGSTHYIKVKFIDQYEQKKFVVCHFNLDDNLSLSEDRRDFYKRQWTGVFYRRFILGEWCLADGLVYSAFDRDTMVFSGEIDYRNYDLINIGIDYGIQNPTAYVMVGFNTKLNRLEVLKDWSYSGRDTQVQKTDDELYSDLDNFIGDVPVHYVYCDPSATSFHAIIRKRAKYKNREADNSVNAGIAFVSMLFSLGQLYIHESCSSLLAELSAYSWDSEASEKQGRDIVLKQSDHSCDALRYVLYSFYHSRAKTYKLGEFADLI